MPQTASGLRDFVVYEEEFGAFVEDFNSREAATAYCKKRNDALNKKGFCSKYNFCVESVWMSRMESPNGAIQGELENH